MDFEPDDGSTSAIEKGVFLAVAAIVFLGLWSILS